MPVVLFDANMLPKHVWLLALLVLIPNVGGWLGSLTFDIDWYNSLNKAPINPPAWVFAPMWTTLYCLMGVASFLVVTKEGVDFVAPMVVYCITLGLNWAYSPILFKYHLLLWSLVEILVGDVVVVLNIIVFWRVRALSGVLLVPLLAWMSIATYLNLYIYQHN